MDAKNGQFAMPHPFDGAVVEIDVRDFELGRAGDSLLIPSHGEAVVLRGDEHAAPGQGPGGLRAEPLCPVSYLRPVEECPTYTEYFKQGDEVPSQLCPIHQGTVKQRVRRAIDGLLSTIGRKLKGIFR